MSDNLIVFAYHYFGEATTSSGIKEADAPFFTSAETFENHLQAIKRLGYTPVTCEQIFNNIVLPDKPIMLTIDDGHASFYDIAFPLLKKYDIPAELFVISDCIDRPNFMSGKQLIEVSANRVSIQSHGKSHRLLNKLSTSERLSELTLSKSIIEEITGAEVLAFAVPMGGYPTRLKVQINQAGYKLCFTSYHGDNSKPMDYSSLKRVMVKQPNDKFEALIDSMSFSFGSLYLYLKNYYKYLKNL